MSLRPLLLAGWAALAAAAALAPVAAPAQAEPLVVGMELEYPPFEMVGPDGQPDGVSVRMAEALAASLGRTLEIRNIKFDALIVALKSAQVDLVISSMTANDERRESIDFSDPYVTTGLALLVPKGSGVRGIDDLRRPGARVVVKLGTTGELYAREHLPGATVVAVQQDPACALEVAQGKADAWIYDQLSIFQHHRQHPNTTEALLQPIKREQWAVGLRKGDDALRAQVNAFLAEFRESGGFDRLAGRYLADEKALVDSLGVPFIFDAAALAPEGAAPPAPSSRGQTGGGVGFAAVVAALTLLAGWSFWNLTRPGPGTGRGLTARDAAGLAVLVLLVGGLAYFVLARLNESYTWNWEGIWARRDQILRGWLLTFAISVASLALCLLVGVTLVCLHRSGVVPLRFAARAYTEIVRGSPLLVILLVGYYVVANAFAVGDKVIVGVLLLALFAGAYLGEILRGGVESVSATQFDAARAVGFDRWQAYRFVIVPQVARRVLPAVAGLFIMLVKDSSLLSVIGTEEFTKKVDIARSATFTGLEGYLPLAFGYLLLTIPLAFLARRIEDRFGQGG
jgi:polar amino acid transport system substrate-binding protein